MVGVQLKAAVLVSAFAFAIAAPVTLATNPRYGGYATSNYYSGVSGYIDQSVTSSTTAFHAAWITICPNSDCGHWVQIGTYQGDFAGGSSPSAVHVYYENADACGDYHVLDKGVPNLHNYPYAVYWNGGSSRLQLCNNGDHRLAYDFAFRKGPIPNVPFAFGTIGASSGTAEALTELQNSPPEGTDWFGCDDSHLCTSSTWGMQLFTGSSWQSWTSPSTKFENLPPAVHTYHNYWSFKTCPSSC